MTKKKARSSARGMGRQDGSALYRGLTVVCFAVLGWLTGQHLERGGGLAVVFAALGVLFGLLGLGVMGWILDLSAPAARRTHGQGAIQGAVSRGFLLLLPFTVLALVAEVGLGWNTVQAFASAGIMLAGAAVGAEMGKLEEGRPLLALAPALAAAALAFAWMMVGLLAQWLGTVI